jgi:4-diphosphocytidyl-2-C-methyl-D-erythritol kinase
MAHRGAGAIARAAPAKLNLYLHVTGKRADGYHLLDSLIAFASVHDTVTAREAADLTLALDGPFAANLSNDGDNLVLRAAKLLRARAGASKGAAIALIKRLPVASGIGGGSADAAATLRVLDELWGTGVPEDDLMALALELGADVPICLYGRAAFVGGIGEKVAASPPLPRAALLLINPGVAVSTAEVFRARSAAFSDADRFSDSPKDAGALVRLLVERRNDLMPPAAALCPEISRVVGALVRTSGCLLARMSGSGATCFGIYESEAAARRAAADIAANEPRWWVQATELVCDTGALAAHV